MSDPKQNQANVLQFPNNIWAGISGFHENDAYFNASPAAQQVPQVKF